ncbi:MAG: hypothetical protein OSB46_00190 [Alphaproteobacteria bacterium]|nr:hypothetical protein [Alphaproteobacteria bacterium]
MDDLITTRATHVVAIVVRIGGLALESMVILPIAANSDASPYLFKKTEQFSRPCAYRGFGVGRLRILYDSRARRLVRTPGVGRVSGDNVAHPTIALDFARRQSDNGVWRGRRFARAEVRPGNTFSRHR